jgi:hypothetical protein
MPISGGTCPAKDASDYSMRSDPSGSRSQPCVIRLPTLKYCQEAEIWDKIPKPIALLK